MKPAAKTVNPAPAPDAARPAAAAAAAADDAPQELDWARVKPRALCRAGGSVQGHVPLAALPRLAESVLGAAEAPYLTIVGATEPGPEGPPLELLELRSKARLTLACQRCLAPLQVEIDTRSRFVLVRDEAAADDWDERYGHDDAAPEPLVVDRQFDAIAWVEDELLLALPLAPRHERCPQPVADATEAMPPDGTPRRRPFETLAGLLDGKPARKH